MQAQSEWATVPGTGTGDAQARFVAESIRRAKAELEGELQEARESAAPSAAAAPSPLSRRFNPTQTASARAARGELRRSASLVAERSAPRAQSSLSAARPDDATAPRRASIATSGGLYERGIQSRQRLERERQRVVEETRQAANPRLNP